jgi:hypothetical protein
MELTTSVVFVAVFLLQTVIVQGMFFHFNILTTSRNVESTSYSAMLNFAGRLPVPVTGLSGPNFRPVKNGRLEIGQSIVFTLLLFPYKRRQSFFEVLIISPRYYIDTFWLKFPLWIIIIQRQKLFCNKFRTGRSVLTYLDRCRDRS